MLREDQDKKHLEEAQSFGASIYFACAWFLHLLAMFFS